VAETPYDAAPAGEIAWTCRTLPRTKRSAAPGTGASAGRMNSARIEIWVRDIWSLDSASCRIGTLEALKPGSAEGDARTALLSTVCDILDLRQRGIDVTVGWKEI